MVNLEEICKHRNPVSADSMVEKSKKLKKKPNNLQQTIVSERNENPGKNW